VATISELEPVRAKPQPAASAWGAALGNRRFRTLVLLVAGVPIAAARCIGIESTPTKRRARAVSAPVGRILWSVQVGVVFAAAGFGLQYVSRSIEKTVSQPLFAMGVLALSIGIGFVISAIASYVLSRRLGLWETAPAADAAAE